MNKKHLKKAVNRIKLPESSKKRLIEELERTAPEELKQSNSEEYVFEVEPAKTPVLSYIVTAAAACAVLAVGGVLIFNSPLFLPADVSEPMSFVDETGALTTEAFTSFLTEYNQANGTELRFPTSEECSEAGTTEADCFEFFRREFPDKEAFLRYVEILAEKGETVISSFHRTPLYSDYGNGSEVIGYYYFPYNASGQTYGISSVEGLRHEDIPDLIEAISNENRTGYITKEDFNADEASTPEEAVEIMEQRKMDIEMGIVFRNVDVFDSDGKTVIGLFRIGYSSDQN